MRRRLPVAAVALLSAAACGSPGSAPATGSTSGPPSAPVSAPGSAPVAIATPSGPTTVAPGESLAAFWARRRVSPAPATGFLDAYAGVALPSSDPRVRAAVRALAGRDWALDHLRLDLVDAGVLGSVGLSGAAGSVTAASARGIVALTSALRSVSAAKVVDVPAAQATSLDTTVVVLRVTYGPTVGTYADGTSATAPPAAARAVALLGHVVTDRLLGSYLFLTQTVDCASAVAGGPVAAACSGF